MLLAFEKTSCISLSCKLGLEYENDLCLQGYSNWLSSSVHTLTKSSLNIVKTFFRADEEAFVADRDDSSTPGHDWERVCRNCDFNPKGTKNTKDVSRMRSIFLQLKQTPLVKEQCCVFLDQLIITNPKFVNFI